MDEEVAARVHRCPRDFLRRFGDGGGCGGGGAAATEEPREAEVGGGAFEGIELSLGLSLGGCFGAEPREKRLVRSSSVATLSTLPTEQGFPVAAPPLARTCSLPAEAEELLKKRKEMQSLKRLEAKRKRLERRNSLKASAKAGNVDEEMDDRRQSAYRSSGQVKGAGNATASPGLPPPAAARNGHTSGARGLDASKCPIPVPRTPGESQGSSSSDASDAETGAKQETDISEVKSNSTVSMLTDQNNSREAAKPPAAGRRLSGSGDDDDPSKKATSKAAATKEAEKNMMERMPYVSTRGDGPNGRRIEGFLYKYRKGEEVRIVCVCHGSFFTPAEFVKHAGGGDVAHPLRHIVVSTSPSDF